MRKLTWIAFFMAIFPLTILASTIADIEKKYQTSTKEQRITYLQELTEYYANEKPNKAKEYANEALTLLKRWPNVSTELAINYALFDAHSALGEYKQASVIAHASNRLAMSSGSKDEIATTHYALANVFRDKDNNYQASIKHLKIASSIFLELNDMYSYAVCMNAIGLAYYYDTQYENALEYYLEAIEVAEFSNDDVYIYANIAMIHFQYKRWPETIRYYKKALNQAKKIGSKALISRQLINLGMAHSFNSEVDIAIEYLNQATLVEKELGNTFSLFDIAIRLGEAYVEKEQYNLAQTYFQTALNISKSIEDETTYIQIHMAIGRLNNILKKHNSATSYILKALNMAEKIKRKPLIYEAHKNLSDIYRDSGNFEKALKHLRQYYQVKEEKFDQSRLEKISQLEEKYKATQRKAEIEQLKNNQLIEALKTKQMQTYAVTGFILFLVISGFLIYWQKKKSLLFAKKAEMMADLMTKKNQILADVSHELATPLTVLKIQVGALKDNIEDDVQATYDSLDNKLSDIGNLIGDIQQLAQADTGILQLQKHNFELIEAMNNWQYDFNDIVVKRGLDFTLNTHAIDTLQVNLDQEKIKQVLSNLLTNSTKYTDIPGKVTLTIKHDNKQLVLEIEDSAPGVEKNELLNIFERLYRIENSRSRETGGSGLGLAICKSLVEAHNGSIYAKASSLGGLKITIKLPLQE